MIDEMSRSSLDQSGLFKAALERALDPTFLVDSHGTILFAGAIVQSVFGWSPEELVGQNVKVLLPEPHQSQHDEYLANYRRTEKTFLVGQLREFEALRKDGTVFPCEVAVSLVKSKPPVFCGSIRDITDRKQQEAEQKELAAKIQQAQKLESLGILAGGIAHDFNNILMGVLGYAGLALVDLPSTSPARQSVSQIEVAARQAADLAKQMLAYSGKGKFVVQEFDLSELVEEVSRLFEAVISKTVVIKYDLAKSLPLVTGDLVQIRQVVMNLITNASDAIGSKSGVVTITTGAMKADAPYLAETFVDEGLTDGLYVYLEVIDTGMGMDEEVQAQMFDPFYSTKALSRGLGLAAVLGIVRGHGGAIKCYSEVGHGTTIKVLLPATPLHESHETAPREPRETTNWSWSGTVLVVDDSETVRTIAEQVLERRGFVVLSAADGREAVDVYRQHADEIVCVLLDMTMPHLNGPETFRELRRIRKDVRVILSSGYNEEDAFNRFAGKGLAGFLQKPYSPLDLINVLREVLELEPRRSGTSITENASTSVVDSRETGMRGTILLADDDEPIRSSCAMLFQGAGYTVLTATGPRQALDLAASHKAAIDVLFLDFFMPGLSAGETIQQFKTLCPDAKVVVWSGDMIDPRLSSGERLDIDTVLLKPCPPQDLLKTVQELLVRDTS